MKTFEIDGNSYSLTQLAQHNGVTRQAMSLRVRKIEKRVQQQIENSKDIVPGSPEAKKLLKEALRPILLSPSMQGSRQDLNDD